MCRFQSLTALVILFSAVTHTHTPTARAAQEPDHLTYTLPADAIRVGPFGTRDPEVSFFSYFIAGADRNRTNLIAKESFVNRSTRISLELFRNGIKHGIQREWFPNGHPKSEFPYRNGLMHGVFKHWDDSGKLVGQYEMTNGIGMKRVFYSNGHMEVESSISNNVWNGLMVTFRSNGQLASLGQFANEKSVGQHLAFHDDGSIYLVAWADGPMFYYDKHGRASTKLWRVNGLEVSETEYTSAAAEGRAVVSYFPDVSEYRRNIKDPIKALVAKYSNLPRVKIPLEFDGNGVAVPRSAKEH